MRFHDIDLLVTYCRFCVDACLLEFDGASCRHAVPFFVVGAVNTPSVTGADRGLRVVGGCALVVGISGGDGDDYVG